jgi:hypothetical protein
MVGNRDALTRITGVAYAVGVCSGMAMVAGSTVSLSALVTLHASRTGLGLSDLARGRYAWFDRCSELSPWPAVSANPGVESSG